LIPVSIPTHSTSALPAPPAPHNGDTADAAPAPAQHPAPYAAGPHGRLARMIVVLCFMITFVATSLIYWRWANVTEPTSYIIVQGTAEHNGTVVTVSQARGAEVVAMAVLKPENQYAVTIFLHPGTYWFDAAQNGNTLVAGDLWVAHRRWKTIALRPLHHDAAAQSSRAERRDDRT
jgi:hypothetical protein